MSKTTALLIIDMQNDYFPGGKMELTGAKEAADCAGSLLHWFRDHELPVIHIAHESVHDGAFFFLPGSDGQRIHRSVQPLVGETVITKNRPNSFLNTPLLAELRKHKVDRLVITGMMTHMCVDATVRAAGDLEFGCILVHDATATRDLVFGQTAVKAEQVQTAFTAALAGLCEAVFCSTEVMASLPNSA